MMSIVGIVLVVLGRCSGSIKWFNLGHVLWYIPFFVIGIQYKKYDVAVQRKINRGRLSENLLG